ncbi:MAG: FAD-binding oxidoreductase [Ktedonobacteraceae bacterium]
MLKESVLHSLKALLPKGRVFTDRATLIAYEVDAGMDKGVPEGVVFPRSTEEVMLIARWASEHGVPLVARGAGTGLSGGAVADRGGLIMEFVHMNRILEVDAPGRSALVEPAMINLRLDERAKELGLYFPPDPASQRASTIGGNVAENSGGPHCFKYGVTTNYITGMEVVLANGRRMRVGGRALDYPEYDLCGLLTGSEGMLGLMTSISVRLVRNPPAVKTLLAVFDSLAQAGDAVSAIISAGLVPATMEMMDQKIVGIIEPFAHANLPLDAGAVLIIEFDGYPQSLDVQADEVIAILKQHGGYNMRVARDEDERAKIWLARKSAGGAVAREAPAYYTVDITVPRSRLTDMLTEVNRICTTYNLRFGQLFHAGDGNLHPMLLVTEPDDQDLLARVHAAGQEMVKCSIAMGGSLSGEHGVGIEKRQFMSLMHKSSELLAMWDVKQVFDPQGLLNPGKVFPRAAQGEGGPFAGYQQAREASAASEVSEASASSSTQDVASKKILTPTDAEQAVHYLQAAARAAQPVTITGATQGETAMAHIISTSALRDIKVYAPDDLYITVGAGALLADVQAFLARDNKQLPLASPWPAATIGGLVAANVNSPQRMHYGALRDNVLCATVALTDGRVIRTGRPLVKNVAGFDITKAFIGSYGTLGLLLDVSLKVMVRPRMKRTLLIPVHNLADGLRWGQHMLTLALTASSILLSKGYTAAALPADGYVLSYTAEGIAEDVQAELAQVRTSLVQMGMPEPLEAEDVTGMDIWSELLGQSAATVARAGVPIKDLATYMQARPRLWQEEPGAWVADFGSGFIYAIKPASAPLHSWLADLREPALALTGYALILSAPHEELASLTDRWGYQPESLEIMRRLKAQWDTQAILNPNTFYESSRVFQNP